MLASSSDKKHAATTGEDPLEEGLKDLTWFESSKRAVKRGLHKTYETFGEEVGNSITAGVPALYLLGLLPFAAINAYLGVRSHLRMRPVSRRHSRRGLVGGSTFRRTPISRCPLDKKPMPGHLFELHPVNEVNTKGQ